MKGLLLLSLLSAFAMEQAVGAESSTTAGSAPSGLDSACYTNVVGMGVCGPDVPCDGLAECDAANPCADGTFCGVSTCCESSLGGVCLPATGPGAGCSNPGVCNAFEACDPVLYHADFSFGAGSLGDLVCGSGSALFVESACALSTGAPSPLDHARWGTTPGSCASYATTDHRVTGGPGPVDISGCPRAVLDFDYVFNLNETAQWDRGFVTVSVDGGLPRVLATSQPAGGQAFLQSDLSCAGSVLPMGNMIADGAWHHFRAPLGAGTSAVVQFYAETTDEILNDGQGWFFDDVRIDCGDLIFANGFDGGNLLSWSANTAPPHLFTITEAGSCFNYFNCDGPTESCFNFQTAEGSNYCLSDFFCGTECVNSAECGAGQFCVVNTCCPGSGSSCTTAACDPSQGPLTLFGPTMAGAGAPRSQGSEPAASW